LREKMPKSKIFPRPAISLSNVECRNVADSCIESKVASGASEKTNDRFIIRLSCIALEILTELDFLGHTIIELA